MYNNVEAVPMEKFAMENEGYHDPVELPDDYLNPSGDGSAGQRNCETTLNQSPESPSKVQNGKAGIRPKNSRFDSGVGDLEHVNIEGVNRNNPRMYDYADYGHQYEELPGGRKSTAKYPVDVELEVNSQYQSSGGTTIVSETADTADIVQGSSEKRKRVNPLYDAMMMSTPSLYSKNKGTKDGKLRGQVRCLKCSLIILFIFCCASLAVSLYTVITYNMDIKYLDENDHVNSVQHSSLTTRLEKLTSDYANLQELILAVQGSNTTLEMMTNLIHKVSEVERNTSAQIGILHKQIENLKKNISQNSETIDVVYTSLKIDLFNLSTSVQQQLDTISKMKGPMGPQGVANFSRCSYSNKTNNSPASVLHPSHTSWLPREEDLEDTFAIYAACSVDNGTGYMLETNVIDASHVQFKCVCSGVFDTNQSRRFCYLHSQIMDALGHSLNFRKGTSECFKLLFKKEEYEYEDRSLGGGKSNTGEQRPASEDQRKWNFLEDECDRLNSIAMRQTPHPDTIQQAKF